MKPNFLIFMLSPLLNLIAAIVPPYTKASRIGIWLFCIWFGLCYYLPETNDVDQHRYVANLERLHSMKISFTSFASAFYQKGQDNFDVYAPLVTYIISRFTDNPRVLSATLAAGLGFFYSGSLYFLLSSFRRTFFLLEICYLFAFAFVIDIGSSINNARMYTALFAFLYFLLPYLKTGSARHLLLTCISVFIHFAFAVPFFLLLSIHFLKLPSKLAYAVFLCSFALPAVQLELVRQLISFIPLGLESRVAGYVSDDVKAIGSPLIVQISQISIKLFCIGVATFFVTKTDLGAEPRKGISYAMILATAINLLQSVGQMDRFWLLCTLINIALVLTHLQNSGPIPPSQRMLLGVLSCFLLLRTAIGVRLFLGFATEPVFLANIFTISFWDEPKWSLYDYIR